MKFKSNLGIAALEELNEAQAVANLSVATEGWKGAVGGFAAGYLGYMVAGVGQIAVGAGLANEVERKKAEIEKIAREIEKAAIDNGKKAVEAGKLSAEDFKKEVNVGAKGVIRGAILGTLFGGIYGAIKGSELEDLMSELDVKCKELDHILKKGVETGEVTQKGVKGGAKPKTGTKVAKEDNEGEDEAAASAAADGGEEVAAGGEEGGEGAAPAGDESAAAAATDVAADAAAPAADAAADAPAADAGADATAAADGGDAAGADDATAASAADGAVAQVEATGDAPDVGGDAAQADPEAEVVEEQMTQVDQIEEKTSDVNEDVEKLEAATESLEGCVAILDAAAQRGGLDIFGASLLRNNVNTVTKSLKVKPLMLPALEDMETPSSKIDGAQTAKEQIIAFIKRIIEAIKSAFVRLGEWIVETYKRLTDAYVALERRAEKLGERVASSTMKEGKLDSKGLLAKISVGGQVPTDVPAVLSTINDVYKYLNDPKSYKDYLDAIDLCEEMLKNPEKAEEVRGKISAKLDSFAKAVAVKAKNNFEETRAINGAAVRLFGNQTLSIVLPTSAETIRQMETSFVKSSDLSGGELPALSQAEAAKICKQVAEMAKAAKEASEGNKGGIKELMAEINKRKETLVALSNAGIKDTSGGVVGDGKFGETFRKAVMFVNGLLLTSPKLPIHAINRAYPRNLNAVLDYVSASVGGAAAPEAAAA